MMLNSEDNHKQSNAKIVTLKLKLSLNKKRLIDNVPGVFAFSLLDAAVFHIAWIPVI